MIGDRLARADRHKPETGHCRFRACRFAPRL